MDDKELFIQKYLQNEGWNVEEDSDVDYSSGEELADRKYHPIEAPVEKPEMESDDEDGDDAELFTRKLDVQPLEEPKHEVFFKKSFRFFS